MPFIIVGTLAVSTGMLLLPYAVRTHHLVLFVIALGIVLFFMSVYRTPAVALMPDITIKPLRSKGNAIINLLGAVGGVVSLIGLTLLDPVKLGYFPIFMLISGMMFVGLVVMILTVKEPQWTKQMLEDTSRYHVVEIKENPHTQKLPRTVKRSLLFLLISVALWFMGYNAIMSAFSRYATIQIGLTGAQSSTILLVANLGAIVSFIPIGIFSSKFGRKFTIQLGVALLTFIFFTTFFYQQFSPLMYINFLLAGLA